MTTLRWTEGDRWAIVAGGSLLLLPDADPQQAERCHVALAADVGAIAVLGLLAGPAGLLDLPPFALLVREQGGARLLVRGVDVAVDGEVVPAGGVLTWVEHVVPIGATVRFGIPSDAPLLRDGVVRCGTAEAVADAGAAAGSPVADRPAVQAAPAPAVPAPAPTPAPAPVVQPEPAPAVVSPPLADPGATLVESVPFLAAGPSAPDPSPREETGELTGLTELLRGAAVHRPLSEAARYPVAEPAPLAGEEEEDLDHDGMTAMLSDVVGREVPSPVRIGAGTLSLGDGRSWPVDRPIIIGRRPQADRFAAGALPHLITVESPEQDVSRSHVEIRPEGGRAVAADLGTTNGTTLRRAGKPPRRLSSHDRHVLADGDVLDLGEDVLLTYRTGETAE